MRTISLWDVRYRKQKWTITSEHDISYNNITNNMFHYFAAKYINTKVYIE